MHDIHKRLDPSIRSQQLIRDINNRLDPSINGLNS